MLEMLTDAKGCMLFSKDILMYVLYIITVIFHHISIYYIDTKRWLRTLLLSTFTWVD